MKDQFQEISDCVESVLKNLKQEGIGEDEIKSEVEDLKGLLEFAFEEIKVRNSKKFLEKWSWNCTTLYIGVLALSSLAITFKEVRIVSSEWTEKEKMSPNFVMHCLSLQLAHSLQSILLLLESGLENPARVLMRSLKETAWTLMVIINDKDKMDAYRERMVDFEDDDEQKEKKVWMKNFSKKPILDSLEELNLNTFSTKEEKDRMYRLYSLSTHCSPLIGGVMSQSLLDEKFETSLFGNVSIGTKEVLVWCENLFLEVAINVTRAVKDKHNFSLVKENQYWNQFAIYSTIFTGLNIDKQLRKDQLSFNSKLFLETFIGK